MKKKLLLTLTVIFSIIMTTNAQWTPSFGPEGTPVSDILFLNGNLYAKAGSQTYYRSADLGDNWEKLDFSGISIVDKDLTMVATANYLVAYHDGHVYYSDDNGDTWNSRENGITTPYYSSALIQSNGNLYLSSFSTMDAYVSTDEGANWEVLGRGGLGTSDFFSDGIYNFNDTLVAPEHGTGAYYSTDGGENWIESAGLPGSIENMVEVNDNLYTCSVNNGIYESDDNGVNWTKIISHSSFNSLFVEQDNLFARTSTDSTYLVNLTAQNITPYTNMGAFPNDIESNGNSTWFGASNRGFHRSVNGGDIWSMANKGMGFAVPQAFGHIGDTYFCIGGGGLWKTSTLGVRWVPTSITDDYFVDMLVVGDDIYACSKTSIKKTSDQGKTWTAVGSGYPDQITSPSLETHGGNLFMFAQQGSNSGLYKLAGFTGNWAKVDNAPDNGGAFDVIGDTIYVAKKYSIDGGSSWNSISGIGGQGATYKIVKTKGVSYMGTNPVNQEPAYKSTDGVNFSAHTSGLPSKCGGLWPHVTKGDTVFAIIKDDATGATRKKSVYYTTNATSTWVEFVEGLPTDAGGYSMYLTPYSLLLGVDDDEAGVYRYDFETLPEIPDTADQIEYPPLEPVDVSLSSLTVDNGTLLPSFSPNQLNYTVSLPGGTVTVPTVSAEANDAGADADVVQATNLTGTQAERTATVEVTSENEAITKTYSVVFSVETGTFINNTDETAIKIYPNPVSDMLTIQSSGTIQSVSIYDLGGKAVKQTMVAGNTATIDLSGLDEGMYLIGVRETGGKMIMNKIIKQ